MKTFWLGALALVLFSGPAHGEHSTRYNSQSQAPAAPGTAAQEQAPPPQESAGDTNPNPAPSEEPAAGGAMSRDDARMNFGTVVDSFVAERSPEGYWPLRDKATGKVRRLKIAAKDPKSVVSGEGAGMFVGRVTLLDESSGERLKADFTVDFSGAEWKVKQMRLIPNSAGKKKRAAARPAPAPESAPAPTPDSMPQSPPGPTGQPDQTGAAGQPAPPAALPAPAIPGPGPGGTPNK